MEDRRGGAEEMDRAGQGWEATGQATSADGPGVGNPTHDGGSRLGENRRRSSVGMVGVLAASWSDTTCRGANHERCPRHLVRGTGRLSRYDPARTAARWVTINGIQ